MPRGGLVRPNTNQYPTAFCDVGQSAGRLNAYCAAGRLSRLRRVRVPPARRARLGLESCRAPVNRAGAHRIVQGVRISFRRGRTMQCVRPDLDLLRGCLTFPDRDEPAAGASNRVDGYAVPASGITESVGRDTEGCVSLGSTHGCAGRRLRHVEHGGHAACPRWADTPAAVRRLAAAPICRLPGYRWSDTGGP